MLNGYGDFICSSVTRGWILRLHPIAIMATADGHSECSVARQIGVDRMNLLRWLNNSADRFLPRS